MPDKLKSAYELAMERLRQKDAESGEKQIALGDRQKEEIAELRRVYQAKLAEREIQRQTDSRKAAAADPETLAGVLEKIEEAYRRDHDRLERERDQKVEAVRRRKSK